MVYAALLLVAVATYVWAFCVRFRYTTRVCVGDFHGEEQLKRETDQAMYGQVIYLWDELKNDFFLVSAGKLLRAFLVVESMFVTCCLCSSFIWALAMPDSLARFSTPVEESASESQRLLIEERLAFKRQIQSTD